MFSTGVENFGVVSLGASIFDTRRRATPGKTATLARRRDDQFDVLGGGNRGDWEILRQKKTKTIVKFTKSRTRRLSL